MAFSPTPLSTVEMHDCTAPLDSAVVQQPVLPLPNSFFVVLLLEMRRTNEKEGQRQEEKLQRKVAEGRERGKLRGGRRRRRPLTKEYAIR